MSKSLSNALAESQLGEAHKTPERFSADILQAIPRASARDFLKRERAKSDSASTDSVPFFGADIWNAYELSWLQTNGKPDIATAEFRISAQSDALIESKSLKLYLQSLNQTRFDSREAVRETLVKDLSLACGAPVQVALQGLDEVAGEVVDEAAAAQAATPWAATCLDDQDIKTEVYQPESGLLRVQVRQRAKNRCLYTNLFRSLCPATGQPDWATIYVRYTGRLICEASLLKYLVSYREHAGFHEQCIEQIFIDIQRAAATESLSVYGRFLRRGGLDINPYRSSTDEIEDNIRCPRQ